MSNSPRHDCHFYLKVATEGRPRSLSLHRDHFGGAYGPPRRPSIEENYHVPAAARYSSPSEFVPNTNYQSRYWRESYGNNSDLRDSRRSYPTRIDSLDRSRVKNEEEDIPKPRQRRQLPTPPTLTVADAHMQVPMGASHNNRRSSYNDVLHSQSVNAIKKSENSRKLKGSMSNLLTYDDVIEKRTAKEPQTEEWTCGRRQTISTTNHRTLPKIQIVAQPSPKPASKSLEHHGDPEEKVVVDNIDSHEQNQGGIRSASFSSQGSYETQKETILVVGAAKTGKTTMIERLKLYSCSSEFLRPNSTETAFVEVNNELNELWLDHNADAIIVVYAANQSKSLDNAARCLALLSAKHNMKHIPKVLVANKSDSLRKNAEIIGAAKLISNRWHSHFIEISSLMNRGVDFLWTSVNTAMSLVDAQQNGKTGKNSSISWEDMLYRN